MSLAVTIAATAATLGAWLASVRMGHPRKGAPVVAFAAFSFDSLALRALRRG